MGAALLKRRPVAPTPGVRAGVKRVRSLIPAVGQHPPRIVWSGARRIASSQPGSITVPLSASTPAPWRLRHGIAVLAQGHRPLLGLSPSARLIERSPHVWSRCPGILRRHPSPPLHPGLDFPVRHPLGCLVTAWPWRVVLRSVATQIVYKRAVGFCTSQIVNHDPSRGAKLCAGERKSGLEGLGAPVL
jgi:hypothetical protein